MMNAHPSTSPAAPVLSLVPPPVEPEAQPAPFVAKFPLMVARQMWSQPLARRHLVLDVWRARKAIYALASIGEVAVFVDGGVHVMAHVAPGFQCCVAVLAALAKSGQCVPVLAFEDEGVHILDDLAFPLSDDPFVVVVRLPLEAPT